MKWSGLGLMPENADLGPLQLGYRFLKFCDWSEYVRDVLRDHGAFRAVLSFK